LTKSSPLCLNMPPGSSTGPGVSAKKSWAIENCAEQRLARS
jgi:hypothetical protein